MTSHTYPIDIGHDSDSHEEVEAKFANEQDLFRKGSKITFYHGGIWKDVLVHLELNCSIQDQTENNFLSWWYMERCAHTPRADLLHTRSNREKESKPHHAWWKQVHVSMWVHIRYCSSSKNCSIM
jgi:hypothetical protein